MRCRNLDAKFLWPVPKVPWWSDGREVMKAVTENNLDIEMVDPAQEAVA